LGGFFDAPAKQKELDKIETQISEPGFWDDSEKAQKVMGVRSRLEKALQLQRDFETGVSDADVLFEFAAEDADSARELETLIAKLEKDVTLAEVQSLLSAKPMRITRSAHCKPVRAEPTLRISARCFCGCTFVGPNGKALRSRYSMNNQEAKPG
jgi:hypothetical protein